MPKFTKNIPVKRKITDDMHHLYNEISASKAFPEEFKCFFTSGIIHDPVKASDGKYYEKELIIQYISEHTATNVSSSSLDNMEDISIPSPINKKLISIETLEEDVDFTIKLHAFLEQYKNKITQVASSSHENIIEETEEEIASKILLLQQKQFNTKLKKIENLLGEKSYPLALQQLSVLEQTENNSNKKIFNY